ncbi:hypothetical protein D3C78_1194270 [compost metagenome]
MLTALLAAFATLSSAERQELVSNQVGERTAQLKSELDARTAAEHALHASEERYRQLIELSPFGVLVRAPAPPHRGPGRYRLGGGPLSAPGWILLLGRADLGALSV